MGGRKTFKIDAFPGSAFRYLDRDAIVCVDVICASTTLVTAVDLGRRAIPAASPQAARELAAGLGDAIVAVEDRAVREGAEIPASPVALERLTDAESPVVLAGRWGTELMVNAAPARAVYVACFRNIRATVRHLARHHQRVVILGAGADGDFRCEDQMATARIGAGLMNLGFTSEEPSTAGLVERWAEIDLSVMTWGKSAAELKREGQDEDLDFILRHLDDLDLVCRYQDGAISAVSTEEAARPARSTVTPGLPMAATSASPAPPVAP